jgi:exosome complex RNA-binding protein Rrp4
MKNKHLRPVPRQETPTVEQETAPEEYAVIGKEQKIVGLTNFHTAKDIATKINGRIWATVTKDGQVEFLYPVA